MSASTPLVRPKESQTPRAASIARLVRADWFRCAVLAAVSILIHSPSLQGERIWDDQYLAHDNPFIKSPVLILESFRHYLFLDSLSSHYRPVQNISYIADYFFWNTDTAGFHLTNMLLHTVSGILLYFLLRQLLPSLLGTTRANAGTEQFFAFLVALVWIVHPVHSAAVDYISGRADSLAFAFASAGWLSFL